MKKINTCINQKDRIVCEAIPGALVFHYQPAETKNRIKLFATDAFSGSVWAYFRDNGRNMNDRGYSLTIREIYSFKNYKNKKLAHIINRIPGQVEYVIRELCEPAARKSKNLYNVQQAFIKPVEDNCEYAA